MSRPTIEINVIGGAGTGKSALVWLINDFLEFTGFATEVNLLDFDNVTNEQLNEFIESVPGRLEAIEQRNTLITINELQARRDSL